ncbi:hypothetical protein HEQ62_10765 [Haematospirillum jordaniae]|uniref:hypothetical protein n=1 Tax=Haematospirillum jordaniae TaxID=1549855 RepID=UPI0012E8F5D4|nr:hypothetical protein [Haematospirillum jordaniae]NKD46218.1 hypothetical protein [Haematospirillum jordaniae]NKD58139.1 hypothetical protein [Haematospirillum jordaniae]NKD60248.1 hypothetical protein [Haematospirillum jordaniae]NKD68186.1 hypothetical protein [Haematospirillum jordaniae]NKD80187.1 hypothetical protein [Haematospirillum jordaniae]
MTHLPQHVREDDLIKAILESDPSKDWGKVCLGNQKTTYFKNNVHLRFESGKGEYFDVNENFEAPWLRPGAGQNPSASSHYFYLFYGATLLKCFLLVSVDGCSAYVPVPKNETVSRLDCHVGQIHSLTNDYSGYYRYIRQYGLRVEEG